ncbi:Dyp-type peroxidase [Candidatus Nitrospira nitrificans]|uniref:Putative Tat-translocated enzyme n=1 Tax=Candidatus Nitrospira nitrificans TaxID=1742973 RepID=A0A0S4LJU5_9BACT|nr:Dyp-type peroxidase [Candidatus Nitrospira nitrificans]CUS37847.1 putative Tat-translocated enzyme [Candidatus Nitrospira nitrificans]
MIDKALPVILRKPSPLLTGPFQSGITDPQWPVSPPEAEGIDQQRYAVERAGRINPQAFLTVVATDVSANSREALVEVFRRLNRFAQHEMRKPPSVSNLPVLQQVPTTYRVTVTIALGSKLFETAEGHDRYGLNGLRPRWLKPMPRVIGDSYDPINEMADLLVLVASDHPYVNTAIARSIAHGFVDKRLQVRRIEQGFSRPDKKEFLKFDDGIDNISNANGGELDRLVYVRTEDGEPDWCVNGSYLVWRKIRENLPIWETMSEKEQETAIGRSKSSGKPLSRKSTGPGGMTPLYPDPKDARDGSLASHIRKVQPRRSGLDLLGISDLDRRFLRRGYPFFHGLDETGKIQCGLLFLAFMRDLRKQFEWPVQMWQTNPDFPVPNTGPDTLYGKGILSNVTGGYYFCPPASPQGEDFVGSGLFVG